MRGNCYVTCEALYHLLGGKAAGFKPFHMRWEGESHWFLKKLVKNSNDFTGGYTWVVIDPTASQFKETPDYTLGKGKGFLTKKPSRRAQLLMQKMLWQGIDS